MTRGDTRIESLRWFDARPPFDDRVVIDMHRYRNTVTALNENTMRDSRVPSRQKGVEEPRQQPRLRAVRYASERPRQRRLLPDEHGLWATTPYGEQVREARLPLGGRQHGSRAELHEPPHLHRRQHARSLLLDLDPRGEAGVSSSRAAGTTLGPVIPRPHRHQTA